MAKRINWEKENKKKKLRERGYEINIEPDPLKRNLRKFTDNIDPKIVTKTRGLKRVKFKSKYADVMTAKKQHLFARKEIKRRRALAALRRSKKKRAR